MTRHVDPGLFVANSDATQLVFPLSDGRARSLSAILPDLDARDASRLEKARNFISPKARARYERWYDALIYKARTRAIPIAYTEMHHVLPRSLGGSDNPQNLVRLHYREHFLAHWLLTKILAGKALRKMQFALWAMTMCANGTRIVAGWQFEVAKRALVTPEMIERAEAAERAAHIKRNERAVALKHGERLKEALQELQDAGLIVPSASGRITPSANYKIVAGPNYRYRTPQPVSSYVAEETEPNRERSRKSRPSRRARRRARARAGLPVAS